MRNFLSGFTLLTIVMLFCISLQFHSIRAFQSCSVLNSPACNKVCSLKYHGLNDELKVNSLHQPQLFSCNRYTKTSLNQAAFLQSFAATGLVNGLNNFYKASPIASAFITCGLKASVADAIAQTRESNARKSLEHKKVNKANTKSISRNIVFMLYGGLYLGIGQHYLYNHIYPMLFGTANSINVVLTKVVFDVCFISTMITLPLPYFTKALIFGYSMKTGLTQYLEDIIHKGLWFKNLIVWTPVQCLTFSVVPEHLRVSFIAAFGFFWLILFSSICSRTE